MFENTSILVVDDHQDIRDPLAIYLRRHGAKVSTAIDAQLARTLLAKNRFDLIVLDIMLPGENGLSLCKYIYEQIGTPVILLTAMASASNRVEGLETGADDYVVKPFDPTELIARIRTVLRRTQLSQRGQLVSTRTIRRYGFANWTLDIEKQELLSADGEAIYLKTSEYRLLRVLVENPHTVFSRDQLLDMTNSCESHSFDRSIDTQVSRLRKKIEIDPRKPNLLKTAWGDGYFFTPDVKALS
jgi:two-component system OmpR family response regulator